MARPASPIEKLWRWCRRKPKIAIPTGTSILLAIITIIALIVGTEQIAKKHRESQQHLFDAEVGRAQLARQSFQAGRKTQALEALERAKEIQPNADLRDEFLRILDLGELKMEQRLRPRDYKGLQAGLFQFFGEKVVVVEDSGSDGKTVPEELDKDGTPIRRFEAIGPMRKPMCISTDGATLAGFSAERQQLEIWDLHSETRVCSIPKADVSEKTIAEIALNNKGNELAVAFFDAQKKQSTVRYFDLKKSSWRKKQAEISGNKLRCLRFSADDRWCGAALAGDKLAVWERSNPKLVGLKRIAHSSRHLELRSLKPNLIAFSPNDRWFAAVCEKGRVRIWDLEEFIDEQQTDKDGFSLANPIVEISPHRQTQGVEFARDNRMLITIGPNQTRLWDLSSGKLMVEQTLEQPCWRIAIGKNNQFLIGSIGSVVRWRYEPPISRTFLVRTPGQGGISRIAVKLKFDPYRPRLVATGMSGSFAVIGYDQTESIVRYHSTEMINDLVAFSDNDELIWGGNSSVQSPTSGYVDIDANKEAPLLVDG